MAAENKDKKLSQDEMRVASAAKRFLRQISISTKNFKMFAETHPFLESNIRNACELLREILATKESATLTFMEGSCLIEDIPLKGLDAKSFSILATAKECGITSLTFIHGVTEHELHDLMKIISGGPNAIKQENGLGPYLQRKNISSIKADEIFFKKVSKKDEEAREAKKHLEDFLIMNYLLGKSAISKDDIQSLVGETSDPKRIGKLISSVALGGDGSGHGAGRGDGKGGGGGHSESGGGGKGAGGGAAMPVNVDFACSGIEKLATHINNSQGMSYNDVKDRIGSLIMELEPAVRSEVLKSHIPVADVSNNIVEDIIKEFSNEAITELIISDVVEQKSPVTQVRKLIARLLSGQTKRKHLLPYVEGKLLQKGISQDKCLELLREPFWQDMTTDEKANMIVEEKPIFCVDIGVPDEIESLIAILLGEKKFGWVHKIIDKTLQNLQSNDRDLKVRLLRDCEKLYMILFEGNKYPYAEELIHRIEEEYKKTKDKDLQQHFLGLFKHCIKLCLENRLYDALSSLLKTVGYESVKDTLGAIVKPEQLLRDMLSDDRIDRHVVEEIAREIGEDSKRILQEILLSILHSDFDSYRKRCAVIRVLKTLGNGVEDVFVRELTSEKTDVVKNSLEALSEIGTSGAIAHVEKLMDHESPEIQKAAAATLKNIKKRISKI